MCPLTDPALSDLNRRAERCVFPARAAEGLESQMVAGTLKFRSQPTHLPANNLAANQQTNFQ